VPDTFPKGTAVIVIKQLFTDVTHVVNLGYTRCSARPTPKQFSLEFTVLGLLQFI